MVPQGAVQNIQYVLFIPSDAYFKLPTPADRIELERKIGELNEALQDKTFIAVGPGRWGTSSPDLGVHVSYSDIYNSRALIELTGETVGVSPEPSFGTHFFQDLMEAQIYPLAVFLDDENTIFNKEFFFTSSNHITEFIKINNPQVIASLRLIAVSDYRPGHHLELVMDAGKSKAVAFLVQEEE